MRTSRKSKGFALILVGVIALFTSTLPAGAQDEENIGFIYPESGPYREEGIDALRGAELAVERINSNGGIKVKNSIGDIVYKKIKLTLIDEEVYNLAGKSAFEQYLLNAIERNSIKMIFGGISSQISISTAEIAHSKRIIFFAAMGASMDITGKDGYKTTFRACSDAWMAARVLGSYLFDNYNAKKYFYVLADYNWGWTTEAAMRSISATMDAEVHGRAKVGLKRDEEDQDIDNALDAAKVALLDQAEHDESKVLILILFGGQFVKAIKKADEKGLNKSNKVQIVVPSVTLTMAEKAGPSLMEGVIGATFWDWKVPRRVNSREGKEFVERFEEKHRTRPSTPAASAYTILSQYKVAVETAQTFDNIENILGVLEGAQYRILKDVQRWREFDHQSIQSVFLVRGRPSREVVLDKDHFEISASFDGDEVAITKIMWTMLRLLNGKAPELD